jgi:branched-chain amino acid aminotransferase
MSCSSAVREVSGDSIVQLAGHIRMECKGVEMWGEELYTPNELWLCGTAAGITPIREVQRKEVGDE